MSDHITPLVLCKCGCGQEVPPPEFPSWQRKYISGHQPAAHRPLAERFWEKVNKNGPICLALGTRCWEWTGALDRKGYGQIKLRSYKRGQSHRVAYELVNGSIAGDMCVCHHCDNPKCVNPSHLFLGTHQDNHDDMVQKGRHPHGESHPQRRLTDAMIADVARRYAAGGVLLRELAAECGVTAKHLSAVLSGRKRKQ